MATVDVLPAVLGGLTGVEETTEREAPTSDPLLRLVERGRDPVAVQSVDAFLTNPNEVAAKVPAATNPPRRSSSRRVIVRPTRSASYAPMASVASIEGVPEASW